MSCPECGAEPGTNIDCARCRTTSKRDRVAAFLAHGETFIQLDARQPGVIVPENLRLKDLVLKISYKYNPPDLELSDRGISCTLSFARVWFNVHVPWDALYGSASRITETGVSWPQPPEPPTLTKRRGGLGLVS